MRELINFVIEKSIVNSFPIFLTILVFTYIAGPFLNKVSDRLLVKISVYSLCGVVGGIWSYSTYGIPERGIEHLEAITLSLAMFIYAFIVIGPILFFINRKASGNIKDYANEQKKVTFNLSSRWLRFRNVIAVLLLIIFSFFIGKQYFKSEQAQRVDESVTELNLDNIDLEKLKPVTLDTPQAACRDDHLNHQFYSECKSVQQIGEPKADNCQVVLTVQNNSDKGKIFTNKQVIEAEFIMVGLTMVWKFENGGNFQLEPNGSGVYNKAKLVEATQLNKNFEKYFVPSISFTRQKFLCQN